MAFPGYLSLRPRLPPGRPIIYNVFHGRFFWTVVLVGRLLQHERRVGMITCAFDNSHAAQGLLKAAYNVVLVIKTSCISDCLSRPRCDQFGVSACQHRHSLITLFMLPCLFAPVASISGMIPFLLRSFSALYWFILHTFVLKMSRFNLESDTT
ncbi:hypothetical protein QCA50_011580 [Cerrena zonata]|uniref:Uncharacterized protein n=1 Tax=Cerrena zonata TaxID=2478898 RepID=A0AAW0G118_9APHY